MDDFFLGSTSSILVYMSLCVVRSLAFTDSIPLVGRVTRSLGPQRTFILRLTTSVLPASRSRRCRNDVPRVEKGGVKRKDILPLVLSRLEHPYDHSQWCNGTT